MNRMVVGVEASNIRAGGGVTHLIQVLAAADPERDGFRTVCVWTGSQTARRLGSYAWLKVFSPAALDRGVARRFLWQASSLETELKRSKVDVLLIPGGTYTGRFSPVVAMSRNLLPFSDANLRREGLTLSRIRLQMLRWVQTRTFRRANGVIYMSDGSRREIDSIMGFAPCPSRVVYHGVNPRFLQDPRRQRSVEECSVEVPFRWLYVSVVERYKLQWNVAEAAGRLLRDGFPLRVDFIGPGSPGDVEKLTRAIAATNVRSGVLRYHGRIEHELLHDYYREADGFVFASTCETFGQIVTEAMAAGLPLASSNRNAIPEVAGDAAVYFDPENVDDITRVMRELMQNIELRRQLAQRAYARAQTFTWERCARETLGFVREVWVEHQRRLAPR